MSSSNFCVLKYIIFFIPVYSVKIKIAVISNKIFVNYLDTEKILLVKFTLFLLIITWFFINVGRKKVNCTEVSCGNSQELEFYWLVLRLWGVVPIDWSGLSFSLQKVSAPR